ncbi:MAG: hypothetical protein C0598_11235 [Marinilabiliales bacterium]|nr:MAG: hypothetical protein C0598_11235 [Marinilabiliales bacterium]
MAFSLVWISISAQTENLKKAGSISYISGSSVYVKFNSTEHISIGDTLFVEVNNSLTPALKVNNLSSISCVCSAISDLKLNVGDNIVSTYIKEEEINIDNKSVVDNAASTEALILDEQQQNDTITKTQRIVQNKNDIYGKISLSSYSGFSNSPGGNSQRMRYTFAMNAGNIGGSKVSAETYISFSHRDNNWNDIQSNIFNGLKIYNFAVKYEPTTSMKIILGRKINPNISNIGAIDCLQAEKVWNSMTVGAFVGSRPDYQDYSFNFSLLQFGGYIAHTYKNKSNRKMKTTFAFVEQQNSGATDRRFAYIQHYNTLAKNLYVFGTAEVELYQNIKGEKKSTLNFTNLYLMLRYKILRNLSVSASYSARTNLIYYETYKNLVDRLLEDEALQGYRFRINFRPARKLAIGAWVGYRSRKDDPKPTKNANAYISYSSIPGINAAATISATLLETAYLKGQIYSLRLSKDLIPGKLYGSFAYRYVDYQYTFTEGNDLQHVGDINLSWRIYKKISFSVSYEGQFEKEFTYNRIYANLLTRF